MKPGARQLRRAGSPPPTARAGAKGRRAIPAVRGLFLSFEGIEGAGKSTQIEDLARWLTGRGRTVRVVREPGGTAFSERLRALLLSHRSGDLSPWSELCLYESARAQLLQEVIVPALRSGEVVLADRFSDASEAYQGAGRGLGRARVRTLNRWITGGLRPERIFLLDLDPEVGLGRIRRGRRKLDRLESEPLAFHRRIRRAYLAMARREPERFRILDAGEGAEILARRIRAEVRPLL